MTPQETVANDASSVVESLNVIKGEHESQTPSTVDPKILPNNNLIANDNATEEIAQESVQMETMTMDEVNEILKQNEEALRTEFAHVLETEIKTLKDKFDYILHNEQVRTTFMLREAHRERQEKITALQTQLECKNIAGVMFVMCAERRRAKLEKLLLIEEYTNYINALKDILKDGQDLILYLSRGYKTAARVDAEWRNKMRKVLKEFHDLLRHLTGGTEETTQYFFDIPALLQTKAPVQHDPDQDPCENDEPVYEIGDVPRDKTWWETLGDEDRPFVMMGDLADFLPDDRRALVKTAKAAKTAPPKWKEYVFNKMFISENCSHLDVIKEQLAKLTPPLHKWECFSERVDLDDSNHTLRDPEKSSRRLTTNSIDVRNMGSILKIVAASNYSQSVTKANLLGARDSMEIASNTRLLHKKERSHSRDPSKVKINVGSNRITSLLDGVDDDFTSTCEKVTLTKPSAVSEQIEDNNTLGSIHNDSLHVYTNHKPDADHVINYEKICPMEKCKRMQMDSFTRTLPPYMRSNPFTQFLQTFEEYEALTPEQLDILLTRIEEKKERDKEHHGHFEEASLDEWTPSVLGVAVQTSDFSLSLPPCTCMAPSPTPCNSTGKILDMQSIWDIKHKIDSIKSNCFFDEQIDFDRFQVIGSNHSNEKLAFLGQKDHPRSRYHDITKILKEHPSLCDIFQGNTN